MLDGAVNSIRTTLSFCLSLSTLHLLEWLSARLSYFLSTERAVEDIRSTREQCRLKGRCGRRFQSRIEVYCLIGWRQCVTDRHRRWVATSCRISMRKKKPLCNGARQHHRLPRVALRTCAISHPLAVLSIYPPNCGLYMGPLPIHLMKSC